MTERHTWKTELGVAVSWSVAGAALAAGVLLATVAICSPDEILRSPSPVATVFHFLAFGVRFHCAWSLPMGLFAAWLGRRVVVGRWPGGCLSMHLPRLLALGVILLPPVLGVWLFVLRTNRLDPLTLGGAVVLAATVLGLSAWGATRLCRLDGIAGAFAPLSALVLVVSAAEMMFYPGAEARAQGHPPSTAPNPVPPVPPEPTGPYRTILLLTVDTLRADHLGAWGYPRDVSPNMDRLASEGILFENALSPSAGTIPSFGVIHTGLHPECNGLTSQRSALAPETRTVAERLSAAGFQTLGVTGNPLISSKHGLNKGFQVYDNLGGASGDEIVARTEELWQAIPSDQYVFVWVLLFDPHAPYTPPDEDWRGFAGDSIWSDRQVPTTAFGSWGGVNLYRTLGDDTPRRAHVSEGEVVARYDGEIRAADRAVGHLLSWLQASGRLDDAFILLTADHGETLVRQRRDIVCQHALQLYEEDIHVPMVLWGKGLAHKRSDAWIQHVDIAPTLIEAAGLPADPGLPGRSMLGSPLPPFPRVSRTVWWDAVSLLLTPHASRAPSRSIQMGGWKLIVHPHMGLASMAGMGGWLDAWRNVLSGIWRNDQLYDLSSDPGERRDVVLDHPEEERRLRNALDETLSTQTANCAVQEESPFQLDEDTRLRLEAAGYLD